MDVELADLVRIVLWPGMLYLIIRMGWRAATRSACSAELFWARAAICVLFISRSITMAQNWHQPLNWAATPFTLLAIVLVWRSKDL